MNQPPSTMSSTQSINSDSSAPDPNPEQRIFKAMLNGVPINLNIFLRSIEEWDAFSTEFRNVCRQYNVERYCFEGKRIPTEPVLPPIPQDNGDEYSDDSLSDHDILLFEIEMCKYTNALGEYQTVMSNLNKVSFWLSIHMSHTLFEVCSSNFCKDEKHDNPRRWYGNLHNHIYVPHEKKMLLERARGEYMDHFRSLRESRYVTKHHLERWLEGLRDIVREGRRHDVPEAVDARRWFGDLVENRVIHAAFRTLPRVGRFISEAEEKIKKDELDYEDVIIDILVALDVNGFEPHNVVMGDQEVTSSVAEREKNVSSVDDEVDSGDISPKTSVSRTRVRTRRTAGNKSSTGQFNLEGKAKVPFEDLEVDNDELLPGTETPHPEVRTRRTRKGGVSETEPHAPREEGVFEGECSRTATKTLLVQRAPEEPKQDSSESDTSKRNRRVTFAEPEVFEEVKDVITVVEVKKVQVEEHRSCAKGEEGKGGGSNDEEVQGKTKKKKSFRGWLRRVGGRVRSVV